MKCTQCGFNNPKGMKFCGQCGLPFVILPDSRMEIVKSTLPEVMKSKILTVKIEGERRNVTVLFADVSGYTALSERLDPEEVRELINSLFKVLIKIVYKYEGTIDKFMGDCIMVLFGAPIAHEDDSERAVHVALEIMHALDSFNEEKKTSLSVHIGINSGIVIAGGVGSDLRMDYTVMGDTVNLASRLMKLAKHGEILISKSVCKSIEYLFEIKKFKPMAVKGKAERAIPYQVKGIKKTPQPKRGISEFSSPLVGRDEEFAVLKSVAERIVQESNGAVVSLIGEAGIGKSRLIMEARQYLDGQVEWLGGRCFSYEKTVPFLAFNKQIRSYLGISEFESESEEFSKLEHRTRGLFESELNKYLTYLCMFLTVKVPKRFLKKIKYLEPKSTKLEIFVAVKAFFRAITKIKPLVLYFEDTQWIDDESLELILFLFNALRDESVLFIFETRPEIRTGLYKIRRSIKKIFKKRYTELRLKPLSTSDVTTIVQNLLTIPDVSPNVLSMVIEKSEGNPFYVEELIRSFIDRSSLRRKNSVWQYTAESASFQVPNTIEAVIRSRIDRLPPERKKILSRAAVIGKSFFSPILSVISPVEHIENEITALESDKFIVKMNAAEYMFRHILIRDVVYKGLLRKERKKIHKSIAECMEDKFKKRIEEYYEVLAYHYYYAGILEKAYAYYRLAGNREKERYHNEVAIKCCTKAIKIAREINLEDEKENVAELFERRGDVKVIKAEYSSAHKDYKKALDYYTDIEKKAGIKRKIGNIFYDRGEYDSAVLFYDDAIEMLKNKHKSAILSQILISYAIFYSDGKGDYRKAERMVRKALEKIDKKKDQKSHTTALDQSGIIAYRMGNNDKALKYYKKTKAIYEKLNDKQGIGRMYGNIGIVKHSIGELSSALRYYKKSLALLKEIGDKRLIGKVYSNIGLVYSNKGALDIAMGYYKKYFAISEEIGDIDGISAALHNIAGIYKIRGALKTALNYYMKSLAISEELNDKYGISLVYSAIGSIYHIRGEFNTALKYYKRYLTISEKIGYKRGIGFAYFHMNRIYQETEKFDKARQYLKMAQRIFVEIKEKRALALVFAFFSDLNNKQAKYKAALRFAKKALSLARETGAKNEEIYALRAYGSALAKQNPKKAIACFKETINIAKKKTMNVELATSHYVFADVLTNIGKRKEAEKHIKVAGEIFKKMGAKYWLRKLDALEKNRG